MPEESTLAEAAVTLPPLDLTSWREPLGTDTERAWQECFQIVNAALARNSHGARPISTPAIQQAFAAMQREGRIEPLLGSLAYAAWQKDLADAIRQFWARPELKLVHLVRFVLLAGQLRGDYAVGYSHWLETL